MQWVRIHRPGGYAQLQLESAPDPSPGPGEVRIAVAAAGVNYADCVVRMGLYASAKRYVGWPITPGFEVAGVVAALGAGVSDLAVGEPVIGLLRFGGYASQVVVPRHQVTRYPRGWRAEEAAGFAVVFLTAWYGLVYLAHARAGQQVLVHSAAGGVGQALVQLARQRGCAVVGVVGGAAKVAAARAAGCDAVIDKRARDWRAAAADLAPQGFDLVFDANGVETLGASYRLLAPAGKLVIYGFASMLRRGGSGRVDWPRLVWSWLRTPRFNPLDLTTENKSLLAFNLSFLFDRSEVLAEALAELWPLAERGVLRPLETQAVAWTEVAAAQRALEGGATQGKLVLRFDAAPPA